MSTPILTKIEEGMANYISQISKSEGYYNNWGSVNEPDVAKQDFPSAEIVLEAEDCIDETDSAWSQAYNQEALFIIRIRACNENEEEIPVYQINKILNKALDDLKRLFGNHYVVSDSCEMIMYKGSLRITDGSNDIFRPAYLDTRWLVKYTQDRKNPSNYI